MSTKSGTTVAQDPSQSLYTPPFTFTANSCLSEDYLLTTDIPVGETGTPVAMWQDAEGRSEALVIGPDYRLSYVYRDPDSDSGWNLLPVAESYRVGEVVAAKDADGAVNAFFVAGDPDNHIYHLRQDPDAGSWASPTKLEYQANQLAITQVYRAAGAQAEVAGLVVCGITSANQPLIVTKNQTTGVWEPQAFEEKFPGQGLQVAQLFPSDTDDLVVGLYTIINGQVCQKCFAPTNLNQRPYPRSWTSLAPYDKTTSAPNTHLSGLTMALDANTGAFWLLAVGADHSLWITVPDESGGSEKAWFYKISGVQAQKAWGSGQPLNGLLQAYVLDTDGDLWVERQSGTSTVGGHEVFTWYDPVPLDNGVPWIYTPVGAIDRAEVFTLSGTPTGTGALTVRLFSQDPNTTDWTVLPVRQSAPPDGDPTHVSSYLTTVSLADANWVPAFGEEVDIISTSLVTIWMNGVAYDVGPDKPVSFMTDFTGKLNIMSPAMGLHTPSLTLTTNGSTDGQAVSITVNPYQQVHDYLAGNSSLNDLPSFDGTALQSAKGGDNQPLVPRAQNLTTEGAQAAANGISEIMKVSPSVPGQPMAAGISLDFTTANNPSFATMNAAEVGAYRSRLLRSSEDFFKRFIGDVWHAVRHDVMKVQELVVDTENKVVHLTLKIGGKVLSIVDVAIRKEEEGIEDVIHIIHTIFAAIGAEIERVVEWLRALFDWDDILNTHKVIEYYLTHFTTPLQELIDNHLKGKVDNFFAGLEDDISKRCDALKVKLGDKKLSELGSKSPTTNGGTQQDSQEVPDPSDFHSHPQHNWVFAKAQANAQGTTNWDATANDADAITRPLQDIVKAVQSALPDFEQAVRDLKDSFLDAIEHPSDFKELSVTKLIDALEHVINAVLKLADGVIEALLDLALAVLLEMDSFLAKKLNIPLLSSLFKKITRGEELNIAGLVALILAVPITLTYKLVHGADKALFTDATVSQLTSPAPTSTLRAAPTAVGDPSDNQVASNALAWTSAGIQGLWALLDSASDFMDETPKFIDALAIGFPLAAQMTWWPNDDCVPFDTLTDTEYDRWNLGMWGCYWVPPIADSGVFLTDFFNEKLAKDLDPVGKVFLSIVGLFTFAASISASVLGDLDHKLGFWDTVANVTGPISYMGQWLLIDSIKGDPALLGTPLAVQVLNDFFTGEFCAAAMFFSAAGQ